jgi:chromosome segregation ATPase
MAGKQTTSVSAIEESSSPAAVVFKITPEVTAAIDALNLALDRRKKLDEAVGSAPAQIAAAESELQSLRSELAVKEADIVWVVDAKVPAAEKEIARLVAAIEAKDREILRTKGRVKALEDRAAEIDTDVEKANNVMNLEASIAGQDIEANIAAELRLKVKELQSMFAKIRALNRVTRSARTLDFLLDAFVPDLEKCMRTTGLNGHSNSSPNLIDVVTEETKQAEAEIAEQLKPISDALAAGRRHLTYVPLARRLGPYVRKGSYGGPGGPTEPPPEVKKPPTVMKTVEEALLEKHPTKGRGDEVRTWKRQPAAEMDIGSAMMQAADSADRRA